MSVKKLVALAILFWFIFPGGAGAQVVTASLQGVVRDQSQAVVPGASVVVRNTATNIEVHLTTGQDGYFLAPSLQPGPYTVTIKAKGFKTLVSNTVTLEVDQQAQLHFVLQVGAATQTVMVTAQAPLLKRTTSEVGQVIDSKQIVNLPLNARNVFGLAFLAPGVHGSVGFGFNNLNMQVNGGRPGSTKLLLDGIPSSPQLVNPIYGYTVFPPVDATQEFKVQTSNYSAQFGNSGSGFINLIYKSGTNRLHGDVYEFLRNSALDANSFFNNKNGNKLPLFHRSQFGFTLGGPVVIPKIYNGHDKTFFFGDFEGLRQGSPASTLATVPTEAMRNGDFSGLVNSQNQAVSIYDPLTTVASGSGFVRSAFAGNIIPTNRINPVSANIINYWPKPNLPGYVDNFTAAGVSGESIDQYDVKVDENVNDSSRFFVRFSRHNLTNNPPFYFPSAIQVAESKTLVNEIGTDVAADYTHTFSPTFLTEFRYGFARMNEQHRPSSLGFDPTQLGFPSYIIQNADIPLFPGISPASYMGIGIGGPNFRDDTFNEHSFSVNNTWIHNNHTLNFGFQALIPQVNVREANQADGSYSFDRTMTQGPNPLAASSTAGDAFASFLLGVGSGGGMYLDSKNVATTSQGFASYIQDDWRVKPKLTLNIGLRWDVDVPRTERYNRMEYFDPSAVNPIGSQVANAPGAANCPSCANLLGGLAFVGTNGIGRSQFSTEWANFGPRFGFAYQAAKNTVIRGAYGIFYYSGQTTGAAGTVGTTGYSAQTTYVGSVDGLTPTNYISNPFPNGITIPPGNADGLATLVGSKVEGPLPNTVVPYSENWNFSIQQMLPASVLVQASYVGSHGVKLDSGGENFPINQLTPAALTLGSALTQKVTNPFYGIITTGPLAAATVPLSYLQAPYPQYNGVSLDYPTGGMSLYHSFQLKVERRLTSGLSLLASFTGEKLIDDFSNISNVGRNSNHQNIYNMRADRSVSANDISRVFSFAGVYQLPFGRGRQFGRNWGGITDALLGGWQMNGILSLETGFPLALHTSNTSHSGSPSLRPNYDPNGSGCSQGAALSGSIVSRLDEYFNTACFSQPAPFTFGNLGRTISSIRVPGNRNIDFSLFKNFQVGERFTVQFRAESFNLLNQVVFGQPNQNLNNSNFGRITGQSNSPRQMQFALKVLF